MKYSLLLFIFISTSCFAQKKYQFDHLLEYQYTSYLKPISAKKIYFYTNSKDNSYYAKIKELDSVNFEIALIERDKLRMTVKVTKQDLFRAENLIVDCTNDWSYTNRYKFRIKDYQFFVSNDTLINAVPFKFYQLRYVGKRKRNSNYPVGMIHYIIKDSTEFHLPLLTHQTAFEEWKKERNIPNGIFQEELFYNYKNEIEYKYSLNNFYKVDKSITVSGSCLVAKKVLFKNNK